jgi:hypothetical protein
MLETIGPELLRSARLSIRKKAGERKIFLLKDRKP